MSVQSYGIAGAANVTSPLIWKDCPMGAIIKDPSRYIHIWEDFVRGHVIDGAQIGPFELIGTNPDIDVIDDELNGVIYLQGSTPTDNDSAFLKSNVL